MVQRVLTDSEHDYVVPVSLGLDALGCAHDGPAGMVGGVGPFFGLVSIWVMLVVEFTLNSGLLRGRRCFNAFKLDLCFLCRA
jgi:hypothetical protein